MKIGGFLPTTLLDYPEKLACTIFTYGCNFRCPFCQNGSLVLDVDFDLFNASDATVLNGAKRKDASGLQTAYDDYPDADILERIKKRKNILEGVCITGGEPTLQKDLPNFLENIKDLGLLVKLDTNGSRPDVVRSLYEKGLIDYVAMDVKSSKENYPAVSGISGLSLAAIEESVEYLIHSGIAYEFRTTLVKGLHTYTDMEAIAAWLKGAEKYYLQSYEDSERILCKLTSSPADSTTHTSFPISSGPGNDPLPAGLALESFSMEELQRFLEIARKKIPSAALRGI